MIKLSLVVPCYNEEGNVREFYEVCCRKFNQINYEIIFVNDGSKDNTLKILKDLCVTNNVKVINFSRNFGKEAAIYSGLKEAKGKYISIIDADLQQDPEVVNEMIKVLDSNEEIDVVAAFQEKRSESKVLSWFKKKFYTIINFMSDIDFYQGASDFRTFRNYVAKTIVDMPEYYRFSKGIFSWVGYNVQYIPYEAKERLSGETKWSFIKLFKYAMGGIVSFSTAPLHLATIIGTLISLVSFIYGVVVFFQKIFFDIIIPGYATIVILILFLGGIQLLVLGIIGEYLAKTYIQGKQRPIYIVKDIISVEEKDEGNNEENNII